MKLDVRLLPHTVADGPRNMTLDETLLQAAAEGAASFRTYCWAEPTISLGYFQAHSSLEQHPLLAKLPVVRRPTGGMTLVHHHELTYALALPASSVGPRSSIWLSRIHEIVGAALLDFDISTRIAEVNGMGSDDLLCFHHITPGDLLAGGHKVVGSAQRRQHGALLQHGAILLAASPHAPTLPGIEDASGQRLSPEECAGALVIHLRRRLKWKLDPIEWTVEELQLGDEIERTKYRSDNWNRKR